MAIPAQVPAWPAGRSRGRPSIAFWVFLVSGSARSTSPCSERSRRAAHVAVGNLTGPESPSGSAVESLRSARIRADNPGVHGTRSFRLKPFARMSFNDLQDIFHSQGWKVALGASPYVCLAVALQVRRGAQRQLRKTGAASDRTTLVVGARRVGTTRRESSTELPCRPACAPCAFPARHPDTAVS